jgi:glycosyltransferase involved in cell wall biosynthesis
MRIAWLSPLPPMPSGISDYTTDIVPYLADRAKVDVVCPKTAIFRKPQIPRTAQWKTPARYFKRPESYDACFQHLANNPYHEFVYQSARRRPEIEVFHDAVLHHMIGNMTIERGGDPEGYEDILNAEYGSWGRRLATLRRAGVATDFEKFLFPLTSHVARHARGIVVHSRYAAVRMAEAAPNVPIEVIPHHAGEPPPSVQGLTREEARRQLGLNEDAFVVGHFGFVTGAKQPGAVVNGFALVHAQIPQATLLMVGADHSGGALQWMVDRAGIQQAVRMAGFVDVERFYIHLRACDAVVNLRYPSTGESSGPLARALAEGRAVIVNNYASSADLPLDVALKVQIDKPQKEQVGQHLLTLARNPELRHMFERNAATYAAVHLDPRRCTDLYITFARQVSSTADGR